MSKEVVAAGAVYIDTNVRTDLKNATELSSRSEIILKSKRTELGGSAPIFASSCAYLGLRTVLVAQVGDDFDGEAVLRFVEQNGVESALLKNPHVATATSFNITWGDGSKTYAVAGLANETLKAGEISSQVRRFSNKPSAVYLGGVFKLTSALPGLSQLVSSLQQEGGIVVLDHGRVHDKVTPEQIEIMKEVIRKVDLYVPDDKEITTITGASTVENAIKIATEWCQGTVVVKRGEQGAATLHKDRLLQVPAYEVTVQNPVGAGDCFNAGLVKALLQQKELARAVQFANATAALKISTNRFPRKEEVEQLISSL